MFVHTGPWRFQGPVWTTRCENWSVVGNRPFGRRPIDAAARYVFGAAPTRAGAQTARLARPFSWSGGPCITGRGSGGAAASHPARSSSACPGGRACAVAFGRAFSRTAPSPTTGPCGTAGRASGRAITPSAGDGRTDSGDTRGPSCRLSAAPTPAPTATERPPTPAFASASPAPRTCRFNARARPGPSGGPSIGARTAGRPAASNAPTPGVTFLTQTTPSLASASYFICDEGTSAEETERSTSRRPFTHGGATPAAIGAGPSSRKGRAFATGAARLSARSPAAGIRW